MAASPHMRRLLYFGLFAFFLGCNQSPAPTSNDADAENRKRITTGKLQVLPASSLSDKSYAHRDNWVQTRQLFKANRNDERLTIQYDPFVQRTAKNPAELLLFERSLSLAGKQQKNAAGVLYIPDRYVGQADETIQSQAPVVLKVTDREFSNLIEYNDQPIKVLADYQSCMVVLADSIERHSYLQTMNFAKWPQSFDSSYRVEPFQCIFISSDDVKTALPTHLYGWLGTSTVYWDDTYADQLTEEQRLSLIDWLRFGGRLVVNGPSSIDALANSYLSEFLPLQDFKSAPEVAPELTERLNAFRLAYAPSSDFPFPVDLSEGTFLSDEDRKTQDENRRRLEAGEKQRREEMMQNRTQSLRPSALASTLYSATLQTDAQWVPGCEGLLAERAIGAGRICMSTFDLSNVELSLWTSYGNFFHTHVLRLPGREWGQNAGGNGYAFANPQLRGLEYAAGAYSGMHLVSRLHGKRNDERLKNSVDDGVTGYSRWSDENLFRSVAIANLQQLTGIQVPNVGYLLKLLCVYVAILVPVNWTFFRLLRRVEWAWIAIPFIAIIGAVATARLLQIEIGFARSQHTIALLQMQDGYDRGLLSQYVSVYSSLSNRFDVTMPEQQGVVAPVNLRQSRASDERHLYGMFDDKGAGIRDFAIPSHAAAAFQAEETVTLDGVVDMQTLDEGMQITNRTSVQMRDLFYVTTEQGQRAAHWLGDFAPGDSVRLSSTVKLGPDELSQRIREIMEQLPPDLQDKERNRLVRERASIANALLLLSNGTSLARVEGTLLGWTSDSLTELEVDPKPSQVSSSTIVCVEKFIRGFDPPETDRTLPPQNVYEESLFSAEDFGEDGYGGPPEF